MKHPILYWRSAQVHHPQVAQPKIEVWVFKKMFWKNNLRSGVFLVEEGEKFR